MKILHIAWIVLALFLASFPVASAQTATVAELLSNAQQAFSKSDYKEALALYEKVFAIESTPINAIRVFVAATYVEDLSAASSRLGTWLQKKRVEARKLGDQENSWEMIESVTASLRGAATRQEAIIREQNKKIEELQRQLVVHETVVRSMKSTFDKQLEQQRKILQGRIDDLRANQAIEHQ